MRRYRRYKDIRFASDDEARRAHSASLFLRNAIKNLAKGLKLADEYYSYADDCVVRKEYEKAAESLRKGLYEIGLTKRSIEMIKLEQKTKDLVQLLDGLDL